MKHLSLSADLTLPLSVVTEKLAILGRTGSGKTYAALKLAELMLEAGAQVGAIDPVGVWRSLRVPAAGGRSFEVVVFGGLYGDLPLEPTPAAGEIVADLVVARRLSFVLDVSQFIPSEQQRFVRAWADRFFHLKKAKPSAVHLFMEECQEYIPENPSGLEAATLGAMQRLWKLGRNFGIGGSLISQRPQEIAKKALNMSGTLFAFQMMGPQERKTVRSWVAEHDVSADIESVLQKLKNGEAHVESPTFLGVSKTVKIAQRVTADLSSTPTVSSSRSAPRMLTPIDIEVLKASMADTIERAKADDPAELRKTITALRAELAEAERALVGAVADVGREKAKKSAPGREVPAVKPALVARIEKAVVRLESEGVKVAHRLGDLDTQRDRLAQAQQVIVGEMGNLRVALAAARRAGDPMPAPTPEPSRLERLAADAPVDAVRERQRRASPERRGWATESRRPSLTEPSGIGNTGARRMLIALAQYPEGLTYSKLAILSGIARSGGTWRTYMGQIRSAGFAEGNNPVRITAAGRQELGKFDPLPTGRALVEYWRAKLGDTGKRRIFDACVAKYPTALTYDEVGRESGVAPGGGTWRTYVGELRSLELVTGRGSLRAAEELFS